MEGDSKAVCVAVGGPPASRFFSVVFFGFLRLMRSPPNPPEKPSKAEGLLLTGAKLAKVTVTVLSFDFRQSLEWLLGPKPSNSAACTVGMWSQASGRREWPTEICWPEQKTGRVEKSTSCKNSFLSPIILRTNSSGVQS